MSGYPEWTPASEPPIESGRYLVTAADGIVRECDYMDTHSWWKSNVHTDEHVIAWMPLPPAYNPPKFGWHPWNEKPKTSGEFLVYDDSNGNDIDVYDADAGAWKYHGSEHDNRAERFAWSYIEPIPGGDPRG